MHGGTFMEMELFEMITNLFLKTLKMHHLKLFEMTNNYTWYTLKNTTHSTKINEPTKCNQSNAPEFQVLINPIARIPGLFIFLICRSQGMTALDSPAGRGIIEQLCKAKLTGEADITARDVAVPGHIRVKARMFGMGLITLNCTELH